MQEGWNGGAKSPALSADNLTRGRGSCCVAEDVRTGNGGGGRADGRGGKSHKAKGRGHLYLSKRGEGRVHGARTKHDCLKEGGENNLRIGETKHGGKSKRKRWPRRASKQKEKAHEQRTRIKRQSYQHEPPRAWLCWRYFLRRCFIHTRIPSLMQPAVLTTTKFTHPIVMPLLLLLLLPPHPSSPVL